VSNASNIENFGDDYEKKFLILIFMI